MFYFEAFRAVATKSGCKVTAIFRNGQIFLRFFNFKCRKLEFLPYQKHVERMLMQPFQFINTHHLGDYLALEG